MVTALTSRKKQILDKAAALFGEQGYRATSMRDLAQAVGIEAASLYGHFSSKEAVLHTIAQACADDFFASVEPIFSSKLVTKEKLRRMLTAHTQVILRNQQAAAIFITEWRHLSPAAAEAYKQRRDNYEMMFRTVVRQGIIDNEFRNVDERLVTMTMLSALNATHQWYRPEGRLEPDQLGETLAETLLEGLSRAY